MERCSFTYIEKRIKIFVYLFENVEKNVYKETGDGGGNGDGDGYGRGGGGLRIGIFTVS